MYGFYVRIFDGNGFLYLCMCSYSLKLKRPPCLLVVSTIVFSYTYLLHFSEISHLSLPLGFMGSESPVIPEEHSLRGLEGSGEGPPPPPPEKGECSEQVQAGRVGGMGREEGTGV